MAYGSVNVPGILPSYDLPLNTDIVKRYDGPNVYRKDGSGTVYVSIRLTAAGNSSTIPKDSVIATLPYGYHPSISQWNGLRYSYYDSYWGKHHELIVLSNGDIQTIEDSTNISCDFLFLTNS